MDERIREIMERRASLVAEMRTLLDGAQAENRSLTAEEQQTYDRIDADIEQLSQDIRNEERAQELERESRQSANGGRNPARRRQPGEAEDRNEGRASKEYRAAFLGYVRKGAREERALQIGNDSEGGYLCPDEYERRLVDSLAENNAMRGLATIIQSDSGDRNIPVVGSHGNANWIAEEGSFGESDDSFGMITLGAHKVGTLIKVSEELLNDSAFDIEAYVSNEFGRRIGAAEEAAFINGNGTGKPLGLLAATGGAQIGVTSTSSAAITADEVIELVYSLAAPYRKKASFLVNDTTIKALRKLKDGSGQYLWQPGLQAGQPDTLLGYRLHTSAYMQTIAAGNKVLAFGDYSYYWISDRQGRHFQRLNELYAATGQVGFRAWQRVDGKLILPEAVKLLACKP